eukprot:TRINITY_DN7563_c0_g1_i1.p2 TRINITY_DN7563_c0_g1~~TRINITY_DN7563_c0_g1_i1.p2  ORF type:complete len:160 (+),score=14.92 TRINITY_DN7563_c0_g1_i1:360-839(+)
MESGFAKKAPKKAKKTSSAGREKLRALAHGKHRISAGDFVRKTNPAEWIAKGQRLAGRGSKKSPFKFVHQRPPSAVVRDLLHGPKNPNHITNVRDIRWWRNPAKWDVKGIDVRPYAKSGTLIAHQGKLRREIPDNREVRKTIKKANVVYRPVWKRPADK